MQDEHLKVALDYRRFGGSPRILVLDTDYLVVRDVVDGATDLGWNVATISTKSKGLAKGEFVASLLKTIVAHRPDYVLTINHLGFDDEGVLAQLLDHYRIPVASWFVDHPLPILGGAASNTADFMKVFCFERTALKWLADQGYEEPVYLPTGSNRRYFHPQRVCTTESARLACPLSFAGNSWWTKARVEPPAWARKTALKLSSGIRVDRQILSNGFEKHLSAMRAGSPKRQYKVAQVALAEASMNTRKRFARALKPLGIRIFGDPHWSRMAPGVDLVPFVDYERGLPALFSACSVNANITAEQMPTAVNQRVWDVPATGGFILTDAQEDALELFNEDEEIVVFRDFEEAADKARYYLKHPQLREAISIRAFEKIEKSHRVTNRLLRIGEVMRAKFR